MRWQTSRPTSRRHIEPWDVKVKNTVSHQRNAYLKVQLKILDQCAEKRCTQNVIKHLRWSLLWK